MSVQFRVQALARRPSPLAKRRVFSKNRHQPQDQRLSSPPRAGRKGNGHPSGSESALRFLLSALTLLTPAVHSGCIEITNERNITVINVGSLEELEAILEFLPGIVPGVEGPRPFENLRDIPLVGEILAFLDFLDVLVDSPLAEVINNFLESDTGTGSSSQASKVTKNLFNSDGTLNTQAGSPLYHMSHVDFSSTQTEPMGDLGKWIQNTIEILHRITDAEQFNPEAAAEASRLLEALASLAVSQEVNFTLPTAAKERIFFGGMDAKQSRFGQVMRNIFDRLDRTIDEDERLREFAENHFLPYFVNAFDQGDRDGIQRGIRSLRTELGSSSMNAELNDVVESALHAIRAYHAAQRSGASIRDFHDQAAAIEQLQSSGVLFTDHE